MSVVVAVKDNGKVYIGADSQVTRGGTRTTLKNPNNYKIWKVKGVDNCLMAHVGNVRDANAIRVMDRLVTEYDIFKNNIDFEFVVTCVVPDIINELKKYGFIDNKDHFDSLESRFIFAYKNMLFIINSDGCVLEIDDCVAIGSGECEAIGSLLSTEGESPKARIVKAIKASAASDIYVDYPIILTDTKRTEFEIITEKNENNYIGQNKEKKNDKVFKK